MTGKEWFCEYTIEQEKNMYALAYSILRNQADADEAVSEAIYRAYSRLDTLRSRRAFKTWILTIVHNVSVEMIRKQVGTVELEDITQMESPTVGLDPTVRLTIRDAVDHLAQPYRTVVVLHYFEDLPVSRISEITGATPAAVRQQLSRARKMLKEQLKEET